MKGKGPIFLVFALLLAIVLLGGIRYGRTVEKAERTLSYIISLTPPTQPPTPSPKPLSVQYKTYVNKQCPVSFLYPSYLKKAKESSLSAQFEQDEIPQLAFSCEPKKPKFEDFYEQLGASESAKVNPATGKNIYFKLNPDLMPLIDTSISFKLK